MSEQPETFSAVAKHLKITFTPSEYTEIIQQKGFIYERDETDHYLRSDYWSRLPKYLVARCPICGSNYEERLDTHSLWRWSFEPFNQFYVYETRYNLPSIYEPVRCEHFVAVHSFLNLRRHLPTELSQLKMVGFTFNTGDIPFVLPDLLPDGMLAFAVMHSLPICGIEHNEFMPKYALYMITYYAQDSQALRKRRMEKQNPTPENWASLLAFPQFMRYNPQVANLRHWVGHGKLHWLDLNSSELALKGNAVAEFPYDGITGYGERYTYYVEPLEVPRWKFWRQRRLREGGRIELHP